MSAAEFLAAPAAGLGIGLTEIAGQLADPGIWTAVTLSALKIVLIIVFAAIVRRAAARILGNIAEKKRPRIEPRRSATILRLMNSSVKYTVNFVAILMILGELGIPLGPMLAGAGVLGLAIGFGAQSLVKDVISGFFILLEDQFAVGDVIQTGNFKGTVEEIGLRTTRIRSWTGEVHIIPNGSIGQVTNFSLHNAVAVVDVPVPLPLHSDIDGVMKKIGEAAARLKRENENALKKPEVLGVQTLGASEMTIRVTCECKPNTQQSVERHLKALIRSSLESGSSG